MEELDIKTAIQIAKILAAAPDERIPMILDVFSKASVDINVLFGKLNTASSVTLK